MNSKFRTILVTLLIIFIGCTDSSDKPVSAPVAKVPEKEVPGQIPKKVTGIFKGELPCKKCSGIQVILTLKDSSFSEIKNYKNSSDKRHSMVADLGTCRQDSGFIHLLNQQSVSTTYRIISQDSLQFLDTTTLKPGKQRPNVFLVKNGNF